jgi:hypothetical protein
MNTSLKGSLFSEKPLTDQTAAEECPKGDRQDTSRNRIE